MTVRSNPRIVLLGAIIVALFVFTVLGFIFFTALTGIIILAVALFLSYQLIRFSVSNVRSYVTTDDESITFHMPTNEDERFEWREVSHAGYCTPAKGRAFAFVYCEERDRLITVPREYEHFDALIDEMESRLAFTRFTLDPSVTIQEKLREVLGMAEPSSEPADNSDAEDTEVEGSDSGEADGPDEQEPASSGEDDEGRRGRLD